MKNDAANERWKNQLNAEKAQRLHSSCLFCSSYAKLKLQHIYFLCVCPVLQVFPGPAVLPGPSLGLQHEELVQSGHQGEGRDPHRPAPYQLALHGGLIGPAGRRHPPAGPLLRRHQRHHQAPLLGHQQAGGGVAGGPLRQLIRESSESPRRHSRFERKCRATAQTLPGDRSVASAVPASRGDEPLTQVNLGQREEFELGWSIEINPSGSRDPLSACCCNTYR